MFPILAFVEPTTFILLSQLTFNTFRFSRFMNILHGNQLMNAAIDIQQFVKKTPFALSTFIMTTYTIVYGGVKNQIKKIFQLHILCIIIILWCMRRISIQSNSPKLQSADQFQLSVWTVASKCYVWWSNNCSPSMYTRRISWLTFLHSGASVTQCYYLT